MLFGAQVVLGDTSVHQLSTLLGALSVPITRKTFIEIAMQADSSNGGNVLIGDGGLSSSRYGVVLLSTSQPYKLGPDTVNAISTDDIYLLASAATQKINFVGRVL